MAPLQCLLRFLFVGSRVLRPKQTSLPQLNQPMLRVLGRNALGPAPIQNTPSLRDLCFTAAWNFLFLPSSLQPRLRSSCRLLFLTPRKPPAPLKGNSLPFSAWPQTRPPDIGITLTISIWSTAVVAVVGQCPPKAVLLRFYIYFPNGAALESGQSGFPAWLS